MTVQQESLQIRPSHTFFWLNLFVPFLMLGSFLPVGSFCESHALFLQIFPNFFKKKSHLLLIFYLCLLVFASLIISGKGMFSMKPLYDTELKQRNWKPNIFKIFNFFTEIIILCTYLATFRYKIIKRKLACKSYLADSVPVGLLSSITVRPCSWYQL